MFLESIKSAARILMLLQAAVYMLFCGGSSLILLVLSAINEIKQAKDFIKNKSRADRHPATKVL